MEAIAAIVFDFDGTLVDSAGLKRAGYSAGLAAVGLAGTSEAWVAYDRHRFSNRRTLLVRCFTELTGSEPSTREREDLCRGYTEHVTSHPEEIRLFPGLARFAHRAHGLPLYVASNAPMSEIEMTCQRLGLRKWFAGIYGHPKTKESAIRQVAADHGAELSAILYVGDHPGDLELADSIGTRFIHLDPPGEFLEDVAAPSVRSLDALGDRLFGHDA